MWTAAGTAKEKTEQGMLSPALLPLGSHRAAHRSSFLPYSVFWGLRLVMTGGS